MQQRDLCCCFWDATWGACCQLDCRSPQPPGCGGAPGGWLILRPGCPCGCQGVSPLSSTSTWEVICWSTLGTNRTNFAVDKVNLRELMGCCVSTYPLALRSWWRVTAAWVQSNTVIVDTQYNCFAVPTQDLQCWTAMCVVLTKCSGKRESELKRNASDHSLHNSMYCRLWQIRAVIYYPVSLTSRF